MSTTPQRPQPPAPTQPAGAERERLSSLIDGEPSGSGLSPAEDLSAVLAQWRQDADARRTWHDYQLIGDVLRSDDLARTASRDLAFMQNLRERLESEPVHVMPAPAAVPDARRWTHRRKAGAALAASFAVAAVALLLARDGGLVANPGSAPVVAAAGSAAPVAGRASATGGALAVNTAGVLRDPRLDEFLRLHQMARGGLAVGVPGGTLQRADLQMPGGAGR